MGFTIFPLWPIVEGRCGCGSHSCSAVGKHPMYRWKDQEADTSSVPNDHEGGIGIATGSRSGIVVIDLDVKNEKNGVETFAKLCEAHGGFIETSVTETASGGLHLYYSYEGNDIGNSAGLLGEGIDVRGEGGYVVEYPKANAAERMPLPQWLASILRTPARPKKEPTDDYRVDFPSPEGERRIRLAKTYLENAPPAIQGQNGSGALWAVACKLVCTYQLPDEVCMTLLEPYNERCVPPWSEKEILHKLADASRADLPRGCAPEGWREPKKPTEKYQRGKMVAGKKMKISLSELTAHLINLPAWENVFSYDVFKDHEIVKDPPFEFEAEEKKSLTWNDITMIRLWFETEMGIAATKDQVESAVNAAISGNKFHPIRDYFSSLPAPQTGILDQVASRGLGCEDALGYVRKTLIGAVQRILWPGCRVDTSLVLCGPQGRQKSTFVQELFGESYVRSQMPDLSDKDASQALKGYWAVELAELDRIVRARNSETVKEFLTRLYDDYRPAYGKKQERHARQCVFIGTTNTNEFLKDATGGRRFWPLEIGKIDIKWIRENRDLIWAEAYAAALAGEKHWFDDEDLPNEQRKAFEAEDPWKETIREYAKGKERLPGTQDVYLDTIAKGDRKAIIGLDMRVVGRVRDILLRLGCKKGCDSHGKRYWRVPEDLQKAPLDKREEERRKMRAKLELLR